jgi:uncharacterized protein (DUF1697 family)
MAELKKVFESLGFTNVKTLLNSGNVVFSSTEKDVRLLKTSLEQKFEDVFTFSSQIIVCRSDEIQTLVQSDPFKHLILTPETRLYVTFLVDEPKSTLKIPYESEENDFGILQVSKKAICSFLILSPKRGSLDLMSFIEKEFGKNVTTRNWNTVKKLAAL